MINKKEVKHIAGLARIGTDEKEMDKFARDLSAVLNWVDELKKVDITGVEPTAHTHLHRYAKHCGQVTGMENRAREDKTMEFTGKDGIIRLFPEEKNGYNKVKSVL